MRHAFHARWRVRSYAARTGSWRVRSAQCWLLLVAAILILPAAATSSPGDLDTTFGGDGSVAVPGLTVSAIATDADGNVLAAGTAGNDLAVARLTSSGALDTSFDGDGIAQVDFGGTGDLVPMGFAAEQAHILVQGSYKFGAATPP